MTNTTARHQFPACICGDVKFAFGNDTPLYIETQMNGCGVVIAIAPRIENER